MDRLRALIVGGRYVFTGLVWLMADDSYSFGLILVLSGIICETCLFIGWLSWPLGSGNFGFGDFGGRVWNYPPCPA